MASLIADTTLGSSSGNVNHGQKKEYWTKATFEERKMYAV